MVMFIYRPEYYGLTETEDNLPATNLAEIIVAKNRNGALKSVNLKFLGHLTKFTDMETYDFMDEVEEATSSPQLYSLTPTLIRMHHPEIPV